MSGFVSARQGNVLVEGLGARVAALVPSSVSGGRLLVIHYLAPPRFAGPALHRHADIDETFCVLEGTLTVQIDDHRHEVQAGQAAFVPRGAVHGFANASEAPTVFVGVVNPAGRLEEMLVEIGRYVAETRGQPDPQRLTDINSRYGVEIVGPPILASGVESDKRHV